VQEPFAANLMARVFELGANLGLAPLGSARITASLSDA
jgi:hypothetical protein